MSFQFHGKEFTFTQPDGTKFEVRGWGDQHYATFETLDGHTVVRNASTGFWEIAEQSEDGGTLVPSGAPAHDFDRAAHASSRGIRIGREDARARGLEAFRLMDGGRRCEQRRQQRRTTVRAAMAAGGPLGAPPSRGTVGDFVGLCLLIDFSDDPATISRDEVDRFCNQQGYTGFGNHGSVYDYFVENSLGRFRYRNVVAAYYRARNPKTYYTDPGIEFGTRARQLIKEALDHLKSTGFNFAQLTVDNEGYVYATNVYYAGTCPNNWSEGLWPHAWALAAPYDLGSGRKAFDYQFTDMGHELALGTFCHENGHMVCDYPDLYDYGYESSGVGAFCLMCAGGRDEKNPTHISAYLKRASGWSSSVTPITHGAHLHLTAGQNQFAIYAKSPTEYFLVENRVQKGRDASLPDEGLAVWHVDELGSNNNEQMTASSHYELSLEQADGRFDLERSRSQIGDAQDLFRRSNKDQFSSTTVPNSKWWDGTVSNLELYEISEAGNSMEFRAKQFGDGTVRKVSSPAAAIPDDSATGVKDAITVTEAGAIASLKVSVDISHTYRGDLQVTLLAPGGDAIVLHRRNQGGAADDLKATYDTASLPALATLAGKGMAGPWTLHVQDLARQDRGVLNRWELEIQRAAETRIVLEESPGTKIPDRDPAGIERTLSTDAAGAVAEIEVSVDITHTYIQDLVVALIAPSGQRVNLHNRTGGSADNIVATYTLATTQELNSLVGQPIRGVWKLHVSDHAGQDVGKLNRWQLKITKQP
jgi:M6 family metalloprotease-like protein